MKNMLATLIILVTLLGFKGYLQADEVMVDEPSTVKGKVVDINSAEHQITIKEFKVDQKRTFTVPENKIGRVKKRDKVKVTLKAGSTTEAENVKVIDSHKSKKKDKKRIFF